MTRRHDPGDPEVSFRCSTDLGPLFVPPRVLARAADPQPSHDAAEVVADSHAAAQGLLILGALAVAGPEGLTAGQLDDRLFAGHHTAAKRLPLLAEQGLVERTGERRANPSGVRATVWRAVR